MLGMLNPPRCVDTTGAGYSPSVILGSAQSCFWMGSSAPTESQVCLRSSRRQEQQKALGSLGLFMCIDPVKLGFPGVG